MKIFSAHKAVTVSHLGRKVRLKTSQKYFQVNSTEIIKVNVRGYND